MMIEDMAQREGHDDSSSDQPWAWTATRMAQKISAGVISSREVVESCLDRISQVNPKLNALVEVCDDALEAADDADRHRAAGEALGPLHGVPVATKVNTDQAGYATTEGVVSLANNVVGRDGPSVARLRAAGAIFLGRSNTPALSFRWFTENDLHGRTLNPWSDSVTPGGSSGGAGSAVASGMVPLAQGTDIGGSVRYPAYACGVVGLRPTVGQVPSWNGPDGADQGLMYQLMNTQGVLGRTVEDVGTAFEAMRGFDPRDSTSLPLRSASPPALERPLRVTLVRDSGVVTPDRSVNTALDEAAGWLTQAGYQVEEKELPLLGEAFRLWYLLCLTELRQNMDMVEELGDDGMKRAAQNYLSVAEELWGTDPGIDSYISGYARRGTLIRHLQEFMVESPLVLMPASASQPFAHDADLGSVSEMQRVVSAQWPMNAVPTLGFPAIAVPCGVRDGLPTGVQLLGRRLREDTILDAAAVIEHHAGVLTPIDPQ